MSYREYAPLYRALPSVYHKTYKPLHQVFKKKRKIESNFIMIHDNIKKTFFISKTSIVYS